MDFSNLSIEQLNAKADEHRQAAAAIAAMDNPTAAQLDEAEQALAAEAEVRAEIARRDRAAALRNRFSDDAPEAEVVEVETEGDAEVEAAEEETEEAAEEETEEAAEDESVQAGGSVATLARKVKRPAAPAVKKRPVSIIASADVPDFGTGQALEGVKEMAAALVARLSAFPTPTGTDPNAAPDLKFAGVAKIRRNFDDEFVLEGDQSSPDEVLRVMDHVGNEKRLKSDKGQGSLTAAGGWCTPSENLYDLCEGETLAGLIDVPEMQIRRGGINFTKGPQFQDFYTDPNAFFIQTEAQAEAGTTKPCYEIECPEWEDHRLDAVGLCVKVPILTNASFPELTERTVRGVMVAYQHRVNADVIGRMVTLAGAPLAAIDFTTTAGSLWSNLERIADIKRQQYRLDPDQSLEVILPFWARGAIRNDLALRMGVGLDVVTDEVIMREFRTRNLAPQFVYDWQDLPASAATDGYPATVDVLMYPAGTYVKGVSDVISLNAVYDAASLATNTYTGMFFEEGLLVANRCFDADLVRIPVCGSGHVGAADIAQCGAVAPAP